MEITPIDKPTAHLQRGVLHLEQGISNDRGREFETIDNHLPPFHLKPGCKSDIESR
jgi:hypothetical protein